MADREELLEAAYLRDARDQGPQPVQRIGKRCGPEIRARAGQFLLLESDLHPDAQLVSQDSGRMRDRAIEESISRISAPFGGKIDVESKPGDTRFVVRLPRKSAMETQATGANNGKA